MDSWNHYLYEQHSETELKEWAARLNMFRYFRAYGGHANDSDSLDVALKYENTKELISILNKLGIQATIFEKKPSQPKIGEKYTHKEFTSFPSLIENTQWIQQPGNCNIFHFQVFIWCNNNLVVISTNPDSYSVSKGHVAIAEKLESKLEGLSHFIVDPPKDTKHYVCPKYHPHLFS